MLRRLLVHGVVLATAVSGAAVLSAAVAQAASAVIPAATAGSFVPVTPARLLDTRSTSPLGAYKSLALQVTGHGGVASGVSAVVLNVTVASPVAAGFITAWGDGAARPGTSALNFVRGQTVPNLVVVPVGADGKVDLYNGSAGTAQLIADVEGYFAGGAASTPGTFSPVAPARLLDTRSAAPVGAYASLTLPVAGRGGVAASVSAVVLNVTVASPAAAGFITAWGDGAVRPGTSALNFVRGQTVPNLVVVPVGADGKVDLYNGSAGTAQLIADVEGYFVGGPVSTPGAFVPLPPARLLDTRSTSPVGAYKTLTLPAAGHGGIPASGAAAVVLNVTVASPAAAGFLTAWGDGGARPGTSALNFVRGQTVPNLVVVPVGADGEVDFYDGSAGSTQVIADVEGYFRAGPPGPVVGLTLTSMLDRTTLRWTNPVGATGVVVRRAPGGTAPATPSDGVDIPVSGLATSVTDTNTGVTLPYAYSVFASSSFGYSPPASASRTGPGLVTNTSVATAPGKLTFHWTNPPGLDHLIARFYPGEGVYLPPPGGVPTGTDLGTATSYAATGLGWRTVYTLTIYAFDAAGNFGNDVTIQGTTPDGDDVPPGPVTAVTATRTAGSVALSWTNPADPDTAGVAIARGDGTVAPAAPTSGHVLGTTDTGAASPGAASFRDPAVLPAHTYTYGLWAVDTSGNYSTRTTITVTTAVAASPPAVTGLGADALPPPDRYDSQGQSVRLHWTAPAAAAALLVVRGNALPAGAPPGATGGWRLLPHSSSFLDTGLPDGTRETYTVWAIGADGSYSAPATVSVTTDPNLPRPVSGVVRNSATGQAVGNVPLSFGKDGKFWKTTSAADGSYRLSLPVGVYGVSATAAPAVGGGAAHGYLDTYGQMVVTPATATSFDPPLTPAGSVTRTVTDASTGRPLANVQVWLTLPWIYPLIVTTTTDSSGHYLLTGISPGAGEAALSVDPSKATGGSPYGYAYPITYIVPDTTGGLTLTHDIALAPLRVLTVTGRVTSAANGAGIGGVGVDLMLDLNEPGGPRTPGTPTAYTAPDGTFTASIGVPYPTTVGLCFDAEMLARGVPDPGGTGGFTNACYGGGDFDPYDLNGITIQGTATAVTDGDNVSMTLQPMSHVSGTVTTADGTPLAGVDVQGVVANRDVRYHATTDAAGRYLLRTPVRAPADTSGAQLGVCAAADPALVGTSSAGYLAICARTPDPVIGTLPATVNLVEAPAAAITGVITDGVSGTPLAGVTVRLATVQGGYPLDYGPGVSTAADGSFTFTGLDPADPPSYALCVTAAAVRGPGGAQYADQCLGADPSVVTLVTVHPGAITRADFGLVRTGTVTAIVTGADTGLPLAGVAVNVSGTTGTTDASGQVVLAGLPPWGTDYVTAAANSDGSLGYLQTDPAQIEVTAGSHQTVRIVQQPAAALDVHVVTPDGVPIPAASVLIHSMYPSEDEQGTAGSDGVARLRTIDPHDPDIRHLVCAVGTAPIGGGGRVSYAQTCVHEAGAYNGSLGSITVVLQPALGQIETLLAGATSGQPVPGVNVTYFDQPTDGTFPYVDPTDSDSTGIVSPYVPTNPFVVPANYPEPARICLTDGSVCAPGDLADGSSGPVYDPVQGVNLVVQLPVTEP